MMTVCKRFVAALLLATACALKPIERRAAVQGLVGAAIDPPPASSLLPPL